MKILRSLCNTLFIFAFSCQALAISASPALTKINKFYTETMGLSFTLENNELEVFVDQKKNLEYLMPRIQASGILPDINPENLKKAPIITVGAICIYTNAIILNHIYKETNADDINVHTYLILPENYKSKRPLFSYKISRSIYNNIDMDKSAFTFLNLVSNFKYSDWYNQNAAKETNAIYQASK
jgi:hypothetical protein